MNGYILAIDQGTTSSRAILFDRSGQIVARAQYPITQHYPAPGWVEHDPMEILSTELLAMAEVYEKSGLSPTDIAAIGITNQRETTIVWEKATGKPVCNAIVWQCRRTAGLCDKLHADGAADLVLRKTGLLIDPYFSGPKFVGFWTAAPVCKPGQRAVRFCLARWTVGLSGISPEVKPM